MNLNSTILYSKSANLFTDFSGKGGYYTSKEDNFERMYIEYQKHIVKGISVILKEPAEEINYQTLLVHFMMTI